MKDLPQLLRSLLADRFKLKAHTESRELPLYDLVLARSDGRLGPDLKTLEVRLLEGRRDRRRAERGAGEGRRGQRHGQARPLHGHDRYVGRAAQPDDAR